MTGKTVLVPVGRRGLMALVDAWDHPHVVGHRWSVHTNRKSTQATQYAQCRLEELTGQRDLKVYMHHLIAGFPPEGMVLDHINGNGLDNRRCNLRFVSKSENMANSAKRPNCLSRFKGVSRSSSPSLWRAYIRLDGMRRSLGSFVAEEEAARAYDAAATKAFGDRAKLNFPLVAARPEANPQESTPCSAS